MARREEEPPLRLDGAVAVVTGGGSGLGRALARRLADAGAVPALLDLCPDRIEATLAELRPRQPRAAGWTCDVANRTRVASVFEEVGNRFGRIDLLVNCAGRSMLRPFLAMSDKDLEWVMGPNLLGVVHCIRAADPWLVEGSRIVNISSVSGRVPTPGEAFYSAMKAAVVSLGESIEAELASRRIGITTVLPGEMSTALFDAHDSWQRRPDFQRKMEVPPERIARAIVRGIQRGRAKVIAPASMRAVLLLQRVAPRLFQIGVNRFYRRVFEPRLVVEPDLGDPAKPPRSTPR